MARSKNETKAHIKDIKNYIKLIKDETGVSFSYRKILLDMENIFIMTGEDRDKAIKEYEYNLRKEIADRALHARSYIWSNLGVLDKNEKDPLLKYSITLFTKGARVLTGKFADLYSEGYTDSHPMTEEDVTATRAWETETLKSCSYHNEIPGILERWDRNAFRSEIETFNESFRDKNGDVNVVFKNEYDSTTSPKDLSAALAYFKAECAKRTLERSTRGWRFMNFLKVRAMRAYIKNTEDVLEKIGFKPEEHAARAIEVLKSNSIPPHDLDFEAVDTEYYRQMSIIEDAKNKDKPENTFLRDLVAGKKELDKTYETSAFREVEELMKKHGIEGKYNDIVGLAGFSYAAEVYDTGDKSLEGIKEAARTCWHRTYSLMIMAAIEKGKDFDAVEMLEDARRIAITITNFYLPATEVKELSELDSPLYLFEVDKDWVTSPINSYAKGVDVKNPDNPKEYIRVVPKEEVIQKANEDASKLLDEWLSDPKRVVSEDNSYLGIENKEDVVKVSIANEVFEDLKEGTSVDNLGVEPPLGIAKDNVKENDVIAPLSN